VAADVAATGSETEAEPMSAGALNVGGGAGGCSTSAREIGKPSAGTIVESDRRPEAAT
jgi:hypothetical protein